MRCYGRRDRGAGRGAGETSCPMWLRRSPFGDAGGDGGYAAPSHQSRASRTAVGKIAHHQGGSASIPRYQARNVMIATATVRFDRVLSHRG